MVGFTDSSDSEEIESEDEETPTVALPTLTPSPRALQAQRQMKQFVPPRQRVPPTSTVSKAPSSPPTSQIATNADVPLAVESNGNNSDAGLTALQNVPTDLSTSNCEADATQIVSLLQFVSQHSDFIVRYLGYNFIYDYYQLSHEFGVFDYIGA